MDWKEKMFLSMKQTQEACQENENWYHCAECPFDEYCTALMNEELIDSFKGILFENLN